MKKEAYEAAQEQLEFLATHLKALRTSRSYNEADAEWSNVISRVQRIFNKLNAGAVGPSKAWLGTKIHERKRDELLQYVHQSRHADEHTLEKLSEPILGFQSGGPSMYIRRLTIVDGNLLFEATDLDGNPITDNHAILLNFLKLKPIINKSVPYQVPTTHLGQPIDANDFRAVLDLVEAYMQRLVTEAGTLVG